MMRDGLEGEIAVKRKRKEAGKLPGDFVTGTPNCRIPALTDGVVTLASARGFVPLTK